MCGCKDIKRGWSPYLTLLPPTMEITVIIVNVLPLPPNDDVQWGLPGCSQQPGRGDPLWSASNGGKWRLPFGCGCCCSPLQLPLIFLSPAASWFYFCVDLFVFCPFFSLFTLVLFLYFIVYSSSPLLDYFPDPFTVYAILFLSTLYTKDLNSCFHPVISLILFFPPKNPEIAEEKKKKPVN